MFRPHAGHRRRRRPRGLIGLVGATLFFALLFPRAAAATAHGDVLHAVDQLVTKTRLLHEANFSDARVKKVHRPQTLHPRHVLQLVRAIQQKANTLAWLNGADTISIGPVPTKQVEPQDVLVNVDSVAWVIDGVLPIFGIDTEVKPAARREGATPNDVYTTLLQLSQMIDGLGTPRTVPNDIYMIVDSIVVELEIISDHYLDTREPEERSMPLSQEAWSGAQRRRSWATSLDDIYADTFLLAKALDRLVQLQPELAPVGGILHPSPQPDVVDADHVSHALSDVLADVVAMTATTRELPRMPSKRLASGMTVAHVSNRLQDALVLVDTLATKAER